MMTSCEMNIDLGLVAPSDPMERAKWFEKYGKMPKHFVVTLEAPHTVWAQTSVYTNEGTIYINYEHRLKDYLHKYAVKQLRAEPSSMTVTLDVSDAINEYARQKAEAAEKKRQEEEAAANERARVLQRIAQLAFDDVLSPSGGWFPDRVLDGFDFSLKVSSDPAVATYLRDNRSFSPAVLDRFHTERERRREAARRHHEGNLARLAAEVRAWVVQQTEYLPNNLVRAAIAGRDVTREVLQYCAHEAAMVLRHSSVSISSVLHAPQYFDADCKRVPTQHAYNVLDTVVRVQKSVLEAVRLPGAALSCTDSDFCRVDISAAESNHRVWRSCLQVHIDHPWDYQHQLLNLFILLEPVDKE